MEEEKNAMSDEDVSAVKLVFIFGFCTGISNSSGRKYRKFDPNPQMVAPVEMHQENAQNTSIKNEKGDQNAKRNLGNWSRWGVYQHWGSKTKIFIRSVCFFL